MRLALDIRAQLVERLPDLRRDRLGELGRKFIPDRQQFLTQLLSASYERRRPHAKAHGADSFDRDFLVRGLRVARRPSVYGALLDPFYEFPKGNRGYSKDRGVTKPYRIRPHVLAALQTVYASDEPVTVLVQEAGPDGPTPAKLPPNGLPPGLADRISVPGCIPISLTRVDDAIARVESWIEQNYPHMPLDPDKPEGTSLAEALRQLYACRKWIVSAGGLPNIYGEQSHGRLGPLGFHLIGLPSRVRHLLFEGSDLVDYDLASCFWSLFRSLGRALGFPTPQVDQYVAEKALWHRRWSALTGHGYPNDFKPVAASWLTGGTLSSSLRTESARRVGSPAMRALSDDPFTVALYGEVKAGMKRIISDVLRWDTDGEGKIAVNAVGATLRPMQKPADFGRLCAHVLTGYEQFAIRELCRRAAGLKAIIYDGFIALGQRTDVLEEQVRQRSREQLGVTLDVQLKAMHFAKRLPDPERDPCDF